MKSKIIIFSSTGGMGHVSALKAVTSYLEDEYEIKPYFIFAQLYGGFDPIKYLSFGKKTGEDFFNFFLRRRYNRILNLLFSMGKIYFLIYSIPMKRKLITYLKQEKPYVLISVIPLVNNILLQAAQECKIPLLVIPTDLDASGFVYGIYKPEYTQFYITIGFKDPLIEQTIASAQINPDHIRASGMPIQKDFFEPKDIQKIKGLYTIPAGKPVIVLLMGGQGNSNLLTFSQQLSVLSFPAHIIICAGKDYKQKEQILQITFPSHISTTLLSFTDRMSDILAIADLLITKSGSISFS